MTVTKFPQPPREWMASELQTVVGSCSAALASGAATAWEIGSTERGDPQLYLLGPGPDHECILCLSRLGRLYVLEDGSGRILFEHGSLALLAEEVRSVLCRKKSAIVARLTIMWCGIREFFEEKVEPVLAEPVEILAHVAPQFAALA
jgi:hypothetical protein